MRPGDTEKTVEVVVLDDDIVEQSENVVLRLSNASTASEAVGVAIADAELSRSITSDDEYALSVDSPSVVEGRSGTMSLTFTVRLSKQAAFQVKAGFSTGDGTATAGVDYVAITDQELTFPAGVTEQQVAVTVNGDTRPGTGRNGGRDGHPASRVCRQVRRGRRRYGDRQGHDPRHRPRDLLRRRFERARRITRPTATGRSASRWCWPRPQPSR